MPVLLAHGTTVVFILIAIISIVFALKWLRRSQPGEITKRNHDSTQSSSSSDKPPAPVSVNYFPSRKCNYTCGFCFHTETSSYVLSISEAKRGLRLLAEAGMLKLNIAGGEPFLYPKLLTELLRYCKEDLRIESTSIVTNGSKVTEKWLRNNCQWLDILAVSCDSFNPETNKKIGRGDDGGNVIRLFQIAEWCREYGIKFKLNTVVNVHNWDEDMVEELERVAPFRWKVFQCLIVAGENDDATRKRDARNFLVTEEQWQTFCGRHRHLPFYVPEDNASMAGSYLLLDEYMCFLDKGEGMMVKSESILEVGVEEAMRQVVWDTKSFVDRGGIYDWGREDGSQQSGCGGGEKAKKLDW
ncbi:radical s-adenosyl methionine domain-containing protein 2 [Zymoseptoria brevis]|uniref:Radical s-adenosyl methionine domain-containing protein 2 n=1 Tax=Zymoseptoria brevis TaxID=1047168 RepID=A0A0F4GL94_9PEZI|nr:radical s-adenosyl methionine domain-containing protein 2 [Zymoseptoria brevis]